MKHAILCSTLSALIISSAAAGTYNDLWIPPVLTGKTFKLALNQTSEQFFPGAKTVTYAFNGAEFWGPTLIMNKGDVVQMHVTNNLVDTTTTHWHGFHIPAVMDGGPHQVIPSGTTWSPTFKVDNNACTYWYHPHLHEKTQDQITHGAGGMIIIRDAEEAALPLPRTYGVDDFPLALTSRRFGKEGTANLRGGPGGGPPRGGPPGGGPPGRGRANVAVNQVAAVRSAYGDEMLVNGTLNPQVSVPAQLVRMRLLNAEIERSYYLGFSDDRTFHVIATDGGLVNAPIPVTRVMLSVGERVEILVDLSRDKVGSSLELKSYNSGKVRGFPGGEPGQVGEFGSLLNNADFSVLHLNVTAPKSGAVTKLPTVLAKNKFWTEAEVTHERTINITGGFPGTATPLFTFDNVSFSPSVFNHTVNLNAVEKWTINNNSGFGHSFHIHDVQFYMTSRTGRNSGGLGDYELGWKDTLFVNQGTRVTFIAKFDNFASHTNPYMYHCHFSNHEDEGLMGQFIVVDKASDDLAIATFTRTGTNKVITLQFKAASGQTYPLQYSPNATSGTWKEIGSVTSDGTTASYTKTDATRLSAARGFYRVKAPVIP